MDLSEYLPFVHLDNESFNLALFELNHGSIRFQQDRLETLFLNPLIVEDRIISNSDLDPDLQFFLQRNSRYFVPDQFNKLSATTNDNSVLSLLHLNIRSLNQNLTKLTDFLKTLNLDFSIIGISETWLDGKNQNCDYVGIEGYNFVHESRRQIRRWCRLIREQQYKF